MDEQNAQYTVKSVPVFVPVFLYAVTKLVFQIKKELFREKNGLTRSLLIFFLKMPKIWVGQMTLNGEKKDDGLTVKLCYGQKCPY